MCVSRTPLAHQMSKKASSVFFFRSRCCYQCSRRERETFARFRDPNHSLGLKAKRQQYGIRHRIASTIHATMGNDLMKLVTCPDQSHSPSVQTDRCALAGGQLWIRLCALEFEQLSINVYWPNKILSEETQATQFQSREPQTADSSLRA